MRAVAGVVLFVQAGMCQAPLKEPGAAAVIRSVDAAIAGRAENVLEFTDIEHYSVYRGDDETHPVAEMKVKDTYKKGEGKTYTILSKSGSGLVQHFGLNPLLDNEKTINLPGNVEKSWFDSANYEMKLQSGGPSQINGRNCYVLAITAKRKAPNTIDGTIWVDARDGTLVKIDGIATQNASVLSGAAHMMREYTNIDGMSMAQHARAESSSALVGRTVVTIDYSDYHLQVRNAN